MRIQNDREALFIACEMESAAIRLYTRALEVLSLQGRESEPLCGCIRAILTDERCHLEHFRALSAELDAETERALLLQAVAEGVLFEGGLMGAAREGLLKDVPSMLALAAESERTSVAKYREFAALADSDEARAALLRIADEEAVHLTELENRRDA